MNRTEPGTAQYCPVHPSRTAPNPSSLPTARRDARSPPGRQGALVGEARWEAHARGGAEQSRRRIQGRPHAAAMALLQSRLLLSAPRRAAATARAR